MNRTLESKEIAYHELVRKINSAESAKRIAAYNLRLFAFCKEVNLWAYWQGGVSHLNADIFLVGQDWGSIEYEEGSILQVLKDGTYDRDAFCYMNGNSNPTNESLCELFKEISPADDKYNLKDDRNTYTELFFTNFVPWYRTGKTISGGFQSAWRDASMEYFRNLVEIIRPKVILCLGKSVFDGVMRAGTPQRKPVGKNYNATIDGGCIDVAFGEVRAKVFPLAHCGILGTMNRNRCEDAQKQSQEDKSDRLWQQKKDWQKVGEVLRSIEKCCTVNGQEQANIAQDDI